MGEGELRVFLLHYLGSNSKVLGSVSDEWLIGLLSYDFSFRRK